METKRKVKKYLRILLCTVCFVLSFVMVFIGQRDIGISGSAKMIAGLVGLIALLGYYNSFYNK